MLQRCLPLTVGRKNSLSRHIATLRARFRLLHLSLSMLQGDVLTNSVMKNVLRERIYFNALDYFRCVSVHCALLTPETAKSLAREKSCGIVKMTNIGFLLFSLP